MAAALIASSSIKLLPASSTLAAAAADGIEGCLLLLIRWEDVTGFDYDAGTGLFATLLLLITGAR